MNSEKINLSEVADFKLLLERLEGDGDLMRELAALYIAEYPNQLQGLFRAIASSDLDQVQHAAHKIKGTAKSFAAEPAAEIASELEETNDFGDGKAISEMAERLSHELRRLHAALDEFLSRD